MSFLDTMRVATASALVQFNAFLIEYKPNGRLVYALLEGREDPCFYRRIIADRLPHGYSLKLVRCGNRRAVINAVERFLLRYQADARVVALIDKDHSDLVPGSATTTYPYAFQTTCYSVENYVCEPIVVWRHCVESMGIPDVDALFLQIESQYVRARAQFYDLMLRCMAWIVASRRRGGSVHLGNLDTGKIVHLDDDLMPVRRLSDLELDQHLEQVTGANSRSAPIPQAALEAVLLELSAIQPKSWLRGKQELWLTATFIGRLAPAVKVKGLLAGSHFAVGPSNALELLAPKCDAPVTLDAFLRGAFSTLVVS